MSSDLTEPIEEAAAPAKTHWSLLVCKSVGTGIPCIHGDSCRFVHSESQIPQREALVRAQRVLQGRMGRGVCRVFAQGGECVYGEGCRFAHVRGDEALKVEQKIEKRRAKRQAREEKYSHEKAMQRKMEEEAAVEERRQAEGEDYEEVDEQDLNAEESFERWIGGKVRACTLYSQFPDIFEEGIAVIMKWRSRYMQRPDIWSRFIKGKAGNTVRIVKEFCESVPVIASVRHNISLMDAEEAAEIEANGGEVPAKPKQVTILDLCSGFGFLSMFLSEMLPAHRVNRIILIDIQWSRKVLQRDIELGRELELAKKSGAAEIVVDGGDVSSGSAEGHQQNEQREETKKLEVSADEAQEKARNKAREDEEKAKYISADHFTGDFYETWPIPLVASKQNLKSSATLRSMQKVVVDRALREGDLMILGIHLCGVLSLRAVDLFNRNSSRVRFFALKPCCLPGIFHAKNDEVFRIGQHSFSAKDVSASGKFVPTSKSKGGWDGPPRKHLEHKFLAWTKNLALGIDVAEDVNDNIKAIGEHLEELGKDCLKNSGIVSPWSKEVQHLQLQESGYQNKYIWVQQRYCLECAE